MVQRVQVQLVDDVDGTKADETIAFSLDGVAYAIDLSRENAQQLRETLARWVAPARPVTRTTGKRTTRTMLASTGQTRKEELAQMRAWAKANGHEVSDRGRVSGEIERAWRNRHHDAGVP